MQRQQKQGSKQAAINGSVLLPPLSSLRRSRESSRLLLARSQKGSRGAASFFGVDSPAPAETAAMLCPALDSVFPVHCLQCPGVENFLLVVVLFKTILVIIARVECDHLAWTCCGRGLLGEKHACVFAIFSAFSAMSPPVTHAGRSAIFGGDILPVTSTLFRYLLLSYTRYRCRCLVPRRYSCVLHRVDVLVASCCLVPTILRRSTNNNPLFSYGSTRFPCGKCLGEITTGRNEH